MCLFFQIRRDALQEHIKENMEKHLDLACSKLKQVEFECTDKVKQVELAFSRQLNCSKFTWKIPNFDQHLQEAKNGFEGGLYGEPFYASPHGYKLKAKLFPNGNGNGENTHLSVFVVVMRGEYDAILPWPFAQKVTFTLIDQQQDTSQRENVVKYFKADPTMESFDKPKDDENAGMGYNTFVSHEKLQTRRYIVDNTIFIQIKVDVPVVDPVEY